MRTQRENTLSSIDSARSQLIEQLRTLISGSLADSAWGEGLLDALAMLATLPLTSHEFGLATNRLHNAHCYSIVNDRGAARFELQLLLGSLKNDDDARPIRRRLRNGNSTNRRSANPTASNLAC